MNEETSSTITANHQRIVWIKLSSAGWIPALVNVTTSTGSDPTVNVRAECNNDTSLRYIIFTLDLACLVQVSIVLLIYSVPPVVQVPISFPSLVILLPMPWSCSLVSCYEQRDSNEFGDESREKAYDNQDRKVRLKNSTITRLRDKTNRQDGRCVRPLARNITRSGLLWPGQLWR